MSLYDGWKQLAFEEQEETQANEFWKNYCEMEKGIYESILQSKEGHLKGSIKELSQEYNVTPVYFLGFLDGVNESLVESIKLEELEEESTIDITIEFDKLYYNMHAAKAEWLYTLEEWNSILTEDRQKEIKKEYNSSKTVVKDDKVGRNDPCPCGSEKKYKKCCGK